MTLHCTSWQGLVACAVLVIGVLIASPGAADEFSKLRTAAPFYADPLFDAAHDAEFVWHAGEQCWWVTYLQNRYNSPLSDPDDCNGCYYLYTDLGLASTPDNGSTWIYRGVMQGLGQPDAWGNLSEGMRQNGSAHGGATWWRPAVVYNPDDKLYHGFFAYLLQSRGESGPTTQQQYHVTHYTSADLVDWKFVGFLPSGASRYDTVVFRIKDGRWLLVSAGSHPPTLQSRDLFTWVQCNESDLSFATDEGPHVTRWKQTMWMNWEPRCDDTNTTRYSCEKNILKSVDGGLHWLEQPESLFFGSRESQRYLDSGQAHQGPLLPQGDSALVLYFTENRFRLENDMVHINNMRSVLQVAPVVQLSNGSLRADRSIAPPKPLTGPNPIEMIDRGPIVAPTHDPVWHVSKEDAMIIALAELNRWTPRWCEDEDVSHDLLEGYKLHADVGSCQSYTSSAKSCVETCRHNESCAAVVVSMGAACGKPGKPGTLQLNTQALAPNFATLNASTAEGCKTLCLGNPKCGSFVFRHANSSAGGGSCGAVQDTCCYLLSDPDPRMTPHPGWDSWAKGGLSTPCERAPEKPSADADVCCKFLPQSALDMNSDLSIMVPNVSSWSSLGIMTSTVQPWRDKTRVQQYFEIASHSGADPTWVWNLRTSKNLRHRLTKERLDYEFSIAANGTILAGWKYAADGTSTGLEPLRQFRRDGWHPVPQSASQTIVTGAKSDDESTFRTINHVPNNLTGSWRLFVDRSNIASMKNLRRVDHQFIKHPDNPVNLQDAFLYGTVLPASAVSTKTDKKYWMWYSIADAFAFGMATSVDGHTWEKPALCRAGRTCATGGTCSQCGETWSAQTALVYSESNPNMFLTRTNSNSTLGGLCKSLNATRGPPKCCRDTDMSLVYTPWDAPKNFKLFNFNYGQDKEPESDADGYYSAHSEDGIVFTDDILTNPALPASGAGNPNDRDGPENHGDVSNFVFDFHRNEYFATIKEFFVVNTSTGWTMPRRSVGVSRTTNYTSWPLPTKALVVDEIDEHWTHEKPLKGNHTELYGLSAFAYEAAYLGFLWVAHFNAQTDGTIEVELVSSADGESWTRAPPGPNGQRPSVLPRGLSPQAATATKWDGMMVFTPNHPIIEGEEMKLFYEGCSNSHHGGTDSCGVGIATMRQHGFVGIGHSGHGESGVLRTVPIAASGFHDGGEVRINYRNTSISGGSIRVAVLERHDQSDGVWRVQIGRAAHECVPLRGDEIAAPVSWSTGERLLATAASSVALEFVLDGDVELFSFSLH